MAETEVQKAVASSLYAIQFGTILLVAGAVTLILGSLPGALTVLEQALVGSSLGAATSKVIAGLLLVFGLYMIWATRRNLRDKIHARLEEARRTQVEQTLERATLRPPIFP